jgi:hypothetical protein
MPVFVESGQDSGDVHNWKLIYTSFYVKRPETSHLKSGWYSGRQKSTYSERITKCGSEPATQPAPRELSAEEMDARSMIFVWETRQPFRVVEAESFREGLGTAHSGEWASDQTSKAHAWLENHWREQLPKADHIIGLLDDWTNRMKQRLVAVHVRAVFPTPHGYARGAGEDRSDPAGAARGGL